MRPIFRNLMGFFNSAVVDFTDETPFRDFVAQLLKARKLESLELKDNWGGNYLRPQIELGRCPACITAKAPSPWIRNTLEEAFYQQSLVRLQLSFGYTHWASKVFLTNLVEGWLSGRFPATTKSVDILGGPDVDMLQRYEFRSTNHCRRAEDIVGPFLWRSYILLHPTEIGRALRITVFARREVKGAFTNPPMRRDHSRSLPIDVHERTDATRRDVCRRSGDRRVGPQLAFVNTHSRVSPADGRPTIGSNPITSRNPSTPYRPQYILGTIPTVRGER
ncbi:hypothetical protein QR680_007521 [Steinernema hermaphroditum]|uniref:Uncharacterized protein n=1 Tax=Steinernema hermaphroditum TaxID=289476 RepID=A0AA39IFW4_9BILA|nr:hypothetical protein QR680_007521 [Steinernema hermaphroditum]